jgi:hypothetical protein
MTCPEIDDPVVIVFDASTIRADIGAWGREEATGGAVGCPVAAMVRAVVGRDDEGLPPLVHDAKSSASPTAAVPTADPPRSIIT